MPAVFATCLLASLVLAVAVAFASDKTRPRWKGLLVAAVILAWVALGWRVAQLVTRTASTLATPGGPRQPHLMESAGREALLLLASHAAPMLVCTALAWLAIKATRPKSRA